MTGSTVQHRFKNPPVPPIEPFLYLSCNFTAGTNSHNEPEGLRAYKARDRYGPGPSNSNQVTPVQVQSHPLDLWQNPFNLYFVQKLGPTLLFVVIVRKKHLKNNENSPSQSPPFPRSSVLFLKSCPLPSLSLDFLSGFLWDFKLVGLYGFGRLKKVWEETESMGRLLLLLLLAVSASASEGELFLPYSFSLFFWFCSFTIGNLTLIVT